MVDQELKLALRDLFGMPKKTRRYTITVDMDNPVTVECEYIAGIVDHQLIIENFTRQYEIMPKNIEIDGQS